MRKLSTRRESTSLPLPAGTSMGVHGRRPKRRSKALLAAGFMVGAFLVLFCLASLLSGSPMAAIRRVHGVGRSLLTAEEEEVAERVREEVLLRRSQQWSRSPTPSLPPEPPATEAGEPPVPKGGDEKAGEEAKANTAAAGTTTTTTTNTTATEKAAALATTTSTTQLPAPPAAQTLPASNWIDHGEFVFEEPARLPGLALRRRTYTPEELLVKFGATDYIYSFANGTEVNHQYRKDVRMACLADVLKAENASYLAGQPTLWTSTTAVNEADKATALPAGTVPLEGGRSGKTGPFEELRCAPKFMLGSATGPQTLGDLLRAVETAARGGADNRDRETDELRHSIRSLEQHVQWHRGRVVIVSPGHHPTWVDGARNFLAGTCGGAAVQALRARGTHLRLTTVHQDAVMPYGLRFTADSHTIEQHIWRVKNATPVHVYMNDDYFVNRDVAITDLFNEYGGTIVRTEGSRILQAMVGDHTASWARGVANTELFNVRELDVNKEDFLPDTLVAMWRDLGRLRMPGDGAAALPTLTDASLSVTVDVAHKYSPDPPLQGEVKGRRTRYYATHAPFVYCTNMFRFFENRYEREFANSSLHHRGRKSRDLFMPFVYNAFVMARPWQASPQFLPYLLQLHESRRLNGGEDGAAAAALLASPTVISMDNEDGCAPATLLHGGNTNGCLFGKFGDNLNDNTNTIRKFNAGNLLYFNVNAGFKTAEAAEQLRSFLREKFPTPVYLESRAEDEDAEAAGADEEHVATTLVPEESDRLLSSTFDALMQLPVIGLVSYDEGVCPLVRSLSLAFANHHRGRVHVRVQRPGEDDNEQTLRETRKRLRHGVMSAIPVPQCSYASSTRVGSIPAEHPMAEAVTNVLSAVSDGSGVELPSTCGAASGTAGLRVRGFVIDARTPNAPVASAVALREALAMPGQTLALEDFRAVHVGPGERDVVLVLARADADVKAVHWITGASESDLLLTYPVPVEAYEDMTAPLQWVRP